MKDQVDFLKKSFLLLGILTFFPLALAQGWNENFTSDQFYPRERTVCLKRSFDSNQKPILQVRSVSQEEDCAPPETKWILMGGKEPQGSFALVPFRLLPSTALSWGLSWPSHERIEPKLWHFTCLLEEEIRFLGISVWRKRLRGDIVLPNDQQDCEKAEGAALKICRESLGGNELLEKCLGI